VVGSAIVSVIEKSGDQAVAEVEGFVAGLVPNAAGFSE